MATDDSREALAGRIGAHLQAETGGAVKLSALQPLAGGACQDNWRVEVELGGAPRRFVLRSDSKTSLPGSLGRRVELEVVRAAVEAGVKTPAPRWPADGLVRGDAYAYFLDWVPGEAIGRRVVKSPELEGARQKLVDELAVELARIHTVTPTRKPHLFDGGGRDVAGDRWWLAWMRRSWRIKKRSCWRLASTSLGAHKSYRVGSKSA